MQATFKNSLSETLKYAGSLYSAPGPLVRMPNGQFSSSLLSLYTVANLLKKVEMTINKTTVDHLLIDR